MVAKIFVLCTSMIKCTLAHSLPVKESILLAGDGRQVMRQEFLFLVPFLSFSPRSHISYLVTLSIQLLPLSCDKSPCACSFEPRDRGFLLLLTPEHNIQLCGLLKHFINNSLVNPLQLSNVSVIIFYVKPTNQSTNKQSHTKYRVGQK